MEKIDAKKLIELHPESQEAIDAVNSLPKNPVVVSGTDLKINKQFALIGGLSVLGGVLVGKFVPGMKVTSYYDITVEGLLVVLGLLGIFSPVLKSIIEYVLSVKDRLFSK